MSEEPQYVVIYTFAILREQSRRTLDAAIGATVFNEDAS